MGRSIRLRKAMRTAVRLAVLATAGSIATSLAASAQKRTLCVHDVAAGEVLAVKSAPGARAAVIGGFPSGACGVRLAGRCEGDWCEMTLGAKSGWVDTRHIGIYEIPAASATSAVGAAAQSAEAQPPRSLASEKATPHQAATGTASPPPTREIEQGSSEPAAGSCVVGVERWDTLRIRSGPGVGHEEIGAIPSGACHIARLGSCRGDWCRVTWRGRTGWVNTTYLD